MLLDQDAALRAAELVARRHVLPRGAPPALPRHGRPHRAPRRSSTTSPCATSLAAAANWTRPAASDYLAELVDAVPTAANLEYHARIVQRQGDPPPADRDRHRHHHRSLRRPFDRLGPAGHRPSRGSSRSPSSGATRGSPGIKEMLWPTMERIEALQRSGKSITGVPSGFVDLDRLTSGFQPSELVIVAARPSMGKTAFCLNIATHAAVEGQGVAIFSLEMSKDQLVQRMLTAEARVDSQRVRQGRLRDADFTKLARAAGMLQSCPVWIDDTPASRCWKCAPRRGGSRRTTTSGWSSWTTSSSCGARSTPRTGCRKSRDISRSLKALARELEVPVVALSQLCRASEQRGGERKPILSDLRDSGAIEQDADLVIFIHRPEYYDREDDTKKGLADSCSPRTATAPRETSSCASAASTPASTTSRPATTPEQHGPRPFRLPLHRVRTRSRPVGRPVRGVRRRGTAVAEEPVVRPAAPGRASGGGGTRAVGAAPVTRLRDIARIPAGRAGRTGLPEFDFVLGGGIVPGSMIAHRRRAGHRQVHAAAAGGGAARGGGPHGPVRQRRGVAGPAPAPRRTPRTKTPGRSTSSARPGSRRCSARPRALAAERPHPRLHPDRLHRHARERARQRRPGARVAPPC